MDFERAEELYDAVADRLAPVLRAMHGDDGLSSPNDLVMHLTPSGLFEALHAAELLNLGPEFDKLRREVNTQEPCDICSGHGCPDCRDPEPMVTGSQPSDGAR